MIPPHASAGSAERYPSAYGLSAAVCQALRAAFDVIADKDQRVGIAISHLIQERVQLADVPVHVADGDQPLALG